MSHLCLLRHADCNADQVETRPGAQIRAILESRMTNPEVAIRVFERSALD